MSKKNLPEHKLNHIRTIANMRLNGFGADIYTGNDGKAYIICDRLMAQIPYANTEFSSLEECENWLSQINSNAAGKLDTVLSRLLPQ